MGTGSMDGTVGKYDMKLRQYNVKHEKTGTTVPLLYCPFSILHTSYRLITFFITPTSSLLIAPVTNGNARPTARRRMRIP
jgi:hypothetical protein